MTSRIGIPAQSGWGLAVGAVAGGVAQLLTLKLGLEVLPIARTKSRRCRGGGGVPPGLARGLPRRRHAPPLSGAKSWRPGSVGPNVGCQALRLLESGSCRSVGLGPGRGAEPHGRARHQGRRVARRSFKGGRGGSRTSSRGRAHPRVAEDLRAIDKPLRKRIVGQRIQPRIGPYVFFRCFPLASHRC